MSLEEQVKAFALRYPGAHEGVACAGKKSECATVKIGEKAFVFLGGGRMSIKLRDSLGEAAEMEARDPERCRVMSSGWTRIELGPGRRPPLELLERWVAESYGLIAKPRRACTR